MNSISILKFMGELGARFYINRLQEVISYLESMIRDKRIIVIYDEDRIYAFLAFSIGEDAIEYWKKDIWAYLPHNPRGRTIYVEKLVSRGWNRELRETFERKILELYPHLETGMWHRWATWGDRKVITKRRVGNVHDQSLIQSGV